VGLRGTSGTQLALGVIWLATITAGWIWMSRRDGKAVQPKESLQKWPVAAALKPVADRWNLLVFLHPRCECAKPTERAFQEVITRRSVSLAGRIVRAPHPDFAHFGVTLSGEALLFDPQGVLQFRGGITPSRSHTGRNQGVRAILDATAGAELWTKLSPVFGCSVAAKGEFQ